MTQENVVFFNFTLPILQPLFHFTYSFRSDHYIHRNFLKKMNLLCMNFDVGNRLENERESDEEPNSTYGYL